MIPVYQEESMLLVDGLHINDTYSLLSCKKRREHASSKKANTLRHSVSSIASAWPCDPCSRHFRRLTFHGCSTLTGIEEVESRWEGWTIG